MDQLRKEIKHFKGLLGGGVEDSWKIKKHKFQESKSRSSTTINGTDISDYGSDYTEGAKLTREKISNFAEVIGIQRSEGDSCKGYDLRSDESQLVNVLICTKHESSGNVLIFTIKVCLAPLKRKNECELYREYKDYGFSRFEKVRYIALKTRNESIYIKLVKFSFPQKLPIVLTPVEDKAISDDILWEKKPIETEFCFVLENINEREMENLYFFGAIEISHGSSKLLTTEFSFFVKSILQSEDISYQSLTSSSNEEENSVNVNPIIENTLPDVTDSMYENIPQVITTL